MNCIVCHYGEIATKGKNRSYFEERLVSRIKEICPTMQVERKQGRIVIRGENKTVEEKLKKVCGLTHFSFAKFVPSEIEEIEKAVLEMAAAESFDSFRVTVQRADKQFPLTSQEVAVDLGAKIQRNTKKKVDLKSPQKIFHIEITPEETYIYTEKIKGLGGLPVSTGGKSITLLSGGIDSPVAAFLMMKRGVKNVFVHFHAYPETSAYSIDKVRKITEILSSFQGKTDLYFVPFSKIQKEILLNIKDKYRVLFYRRFMARIAEQIALREKAEALVTGESLGQVASQTINNLRATESVANIPLLRPLVGFDKEEIISKAKEIETYSVSITEDDDCCVRFLPRYPETNADIGALEEEEKKIKSKKMIEDALKEISKETINP